MTMSMAKVAAIVASVGLVLGSFALVSSARAATVAELQAMIAQLTAQIAALSGSTAAPAASFTKDLTIGSTGADVTALQNWLISGGYSVPAGATGYFGEQTKMALAAYQAKVGITPASGYFGPITRAKVNMAAPSTSTTGSTSTGSTGSVALSGGEGQVSNIDALGDIESTVDEGKTEQVVGAEIEAQDSDIAVQRVDVEISTADASGNESSHLDDYITEASLVFNGKTIATMDVDEADEDNDVYTFRFSGLNAVIKEDDTADLYVAVTAVKNVDSADSAVNLEVKIPEDGIRAVDAAGISDTYVSSSEETALTETFGIGEPNGGELDINEGDTNIDSKTVQADEEDDTNGVLALAFNLEAKEQDINVDSIPVGLVTSENEGVDGPVKRAILKMDGKTIKTKTIPASAGTSYEVLFDNLDLDIKDGDEPEFEVYVDLNDLDLTTFASGTTLYATTTGSDYDDAEDEAGDNVSVDGSVDNSSDGLLTFQAQGIDVKLVSMSSVTTTVDSTDNDYATYTMVLDVTAFEEDAYILQAGASAITYRFENASSAANLGTSTATTTVISSNASTSGSSYKVGANQTKRFTITTTLDPLAANEGASYRMQLLSVIFGSDNSGTGQSWTAAPATTYETVGTLIAD